MFASILEKKYAPHLLSLFAGAIMPLALAPVFWWPIAILSLVLLTAVLKGASVKQATLRGWLFGLGQFSTGVSWVYVSMHTHGGTPAFLAVLMVLGFAAFLALFPTSMIYLHQKLFKDSPWFAITLAVFWTINEWLRSWVFTGFPWLFIGDAHLNTWLSGWAPVFGIYGLTLFSALTSAALFMLWKSKQFQLLLVTAGLWLTGFYLQGIEWTQAKEEITVTAVQGNIAQEIKWLPEQRAPTINAYTNAANRNWDSDIILWPETAVTLFRDQFKPYSAGLQADAVRHKSTVITGIPFRYTSGPRKGEFFNSITTYGAHQNIYSKQKLVPFGEYIPLESTIRGLLPFFDLPMSSFSEGSDEQKLLKASGKQDQLILLAPYICYEIAYSRFVAETARNSDMLITISNDAWFGGSLAPHQHMGLAQMRALETQRYILRSTNTGITAIADHKGNILKQIPVNERGTLTAKAVLRSGDTPYMQWNVWPVAGFALLIIALAWFRQRQSAQ